jgi:hypothetical protein
MHEFGERIIPPEEVGVSKDAEGRPQIMDRVLERDGTVFSYTIGTPEAIAHLKVLNTKLDPEFHHDTNIFPIGKEELLNPNRVAEIIDTTPFDVLQPYLTAQIEDEEEPTT